MGAGTRIKEIRKEMGLTQRGFGKEIGVSNNYISEIEAEKKVPATPVLLSIEYIYGVNRKWILEGKGEKYLKDKIHFTNQDIEIIKSIRGMSEENKKMIVALIEKLRKES